MSTANVVCHALPGEMGLSALAMVLADQGVDEARVFEALCHYVGAQACGRGAAPPGAARLADELWVVGGNRERALAAAPLLRLALDRLDAAARERAAWLCVDGSFDGLAAIQDGRIVRGNAAFCEIFGLSPRELVGIELEGLFAAESRGTVRGGLAAGRLVAQETVGLTVSGERRPIRVRLRPCPAGTDCTWQLAVQDRREEARLQATLAAAEVAAQQAIHGQMQALAGLGHELRTPLSGVLGMAELLGAGSLSTEQRGQIAVVHDSAVQLVGILDNALDLAAVRAGELEITTAPASLREITGGAVEATQVAAARAGRTLRLVLHPGLPIWWILDGARVRQVLANLLGHALEHGGDGAVQLELEPSEEGFVCWVRDGGRGLSAGVLGPAAGMGPPRDPPVGLAVCHELVRAMGGSLQIHRMAAGGTTVRMALRAARLPARVPRGCRVALVGAAHGALAASLEARGATVAAFSRPERGELLAWAPDLVHWAQGRPRSGPWIATCERAWPGQPGLHLVGPAVLAEELLGHALAPELDSSPVAQVSTRSLDVLVVEDNIINQLVMGALLRRAGHRVEIAQNGRIGLERAKTTSFDLILMDVQMPVMDGLEATRALRSAGCAAPIYALTAHTLAEDRADCVVAGMDGLLTKPVRVPQIAEVLSALGGHVPVLGCGD